MRAQRRPCSILWIAVVHNADSSSLFNDLDAALQSGSENRVALPRRVTNLFLSEADRLSEEQIGVFDGVPVQLIQRIEARTLMELSERLAPATRASFDLTPNLARHSEIRIARPHGSVPKAGYEKLQIDFAKLSKSNARRLLRFWQLRGVRARST